ncbi:MAG: hypothetical protein ACJAT4_000663 [Granulosicoccus sp.]|jgi:hypothetical protein
MKNIFWLFLFVLFFLSCEKHDEIHIESVLGEYFHTIPSDDYSHLELRSDFTYHFDQAHSHSCEIWGHHYGEWKIKNDKIILYQGIDLDTFVSVKTKRNYESDTLDIFFEQDLLDSFPNLKVRFGWIKKDYEIEQDEIIFDKFSFCSENRIFSDTSIYPFDKKSTYTYYPLEIKLRSGNFYKEIDHILKYGELKIGLNDFKNDYLKPKKLLEYKLKNGILISKGKDEWINKHQLIQREEVGF